MVAVSLKICGHISLALGGKIGRGQPSTMRAGIWQTFCGAASSVQILGE
jgi:hypothetical protein